MLNKQSDNKNSFKLVKIIKNNLITTIKSTSVI